MTIRTLTNSCISTYIFVYNAFIYILSSVKEKETTTTNQYKIISNKINTSPWAAVKSD